MRNCSGLQTESFPLILVFSAFFQQENEFAGVSVQSRSRLFVKTEEK